MAEWKIRRGDSEWPVESVAMLQDWARAGRIIGSDYIFNPVLGKWMYAADVLELRSQLAQAPNTGGSSPSVSERVPPSNRGGFDTNVFGVIILVIGLLLTVLGGVVSATNGRLTNEGTYTYENERRLAARQQATTMILIGLPAIVIGGAIVASSKSQRSKYAGETPSAQNTQAAWRCASCGHGNHAPDPQIPLSLSLARSLARCAACGEERSA
jgi:uncharacterized membrane protein